MSATGTITAGHELAARLIEVLDQEVQPPPEVVRDAYHLIKTSPLAVAPDTANLIANLLDKHEERKRIADYHRDQARLRSREAGIQAAHDEAWTTLPPVAQALAYVGYLHDSALGAALNQVAQLLVDQAAGVAVPVPSGFRWNHLRPTKDT